VHQELTLYILGRSWRTLHLARGTCQADYWSRAHWRGTKPDQSKLDGPYAPYACCKARTCDAGNERSMALCPTANQEKRCKDKYPVHSYDLPCSDFFSWLNANIYCAVEITKFLSLLFSPCGFLSLQYDMPKCSVTRLEYSSKIT
jgi:hypothetical protein